MIPPLTVAEILVDDMQIQMDILGELVDELRDHYPYGDTDSLLTDMGEISDEIDLLLGRLDNWRLCYLDAPSGLDADLTPFPPQGA